MASDAPARPRTRLCLVGAPADLALIGGLSVACLPRLRLICGGGSTPAVDQRAESPPYGPLFREVRGVLGLFGRFERSGL